MHKEYNSNWFAHKIDLTSLLESNNTLQKEFNGRKKIIKKGNYIYLPDDISDHIYIILEGKIKIGYFRDGDKEVVTTILEKGKIFSEKSILGEKKQKDFAIAMVDSMIVSFLQLDFDQLLNEHKDLSVLMMQIMGERMMEMESRLESLVFKDSRSRIIDFLIKSVEKNGQRIGYEWVVRNFLTHQDIASLTSTSRQSVTMVLNDLRNENIIQFDRKRLLIRDLDKLRSLIK